MTLTNQHDPPIRRPRASTILRLIMERADHLTRFALPVRHPRRRGNEYPLVTWTMQEREAGYSFVERLTANPFAVTWRWSTQSAARNAMAERIATTFRTTYAQQWLIDDLLFATYGLGVYNSCPSPSFVGLVGDGGFIERPPEQDRAQRERWWEGLEQAEHINKRIIESLRALFQRKQIPLCVLVDPVVT